jgi:hypothetical protein
LVPMESHTVNANQRFADYCHERGVDENEAVIAMTVACHIDALHIIEKRGYSAVSLTKEPSHIMQAAGVLNVGKGIQQSNVDWVKVKHYLGLGEKLRM